MSDDARRAEDLRRTRWAVPMTPAEIADLEGVYFYDDGYAAADGVQRLLATLDAARSPEPLDVERLALAIHRSNDHGNRPGCLDMDRDSARMLAAEYARLATTAPEEHGE